MKFSEAIKNFLILHTYEDLSSLYSKEMEVQILVDKGEGTKIENDFKGRSGDSFTNGIETWYPYRIPRKAYSEVEDNDREVNYNFDKRILGIGMTGWDWVNRKSVWVGFDFDSIIGHSSKSLTDIELKEIIEQVEGIPWVTLRKSTSGNGLHLYVFVDKEHIKNHIEHSSLARYVLGMMSAITGFDFQSKVDAMGGVLWQWHKKKEGTDGLKLLKQGNILRNIPEDWRDHIPVIEGKRKKTVPFFIDSNLPESEKQFLEMTGQRSRIDFDEGHKKLINWLSENGHSCSYNQDHHLIVSHTHSLKLAHQELGLKGIFDTISEGREKGDHNLFMYPLPNGAWIVKRFSIGIQEASTWEIDRSGYTSCFFNKSPDLRIAARTYGGLEDERGSYIFNSADEAQMAANMLGVDFDLPRWATIKKTILKRHTDGRLFVQLDYDAQRDIINGGLKGWFIDKSKKHWCRLYNTRLEEPSEIQVVNFDDSIRHLVTPDGNNAGWAIKIGDNWQNEPLVHVSKVLKSYNYKNTEVEVILGNRIVKSWKIVSKPFQLEYPGDRQWNRNAPQLKYALLKDKENLQYPTWLKMLNHLGKYLDDPVKNNKWCKENNVLTGADYLKLWIASLFQYPLEPLPYLFFYGSELSGKSSFHEAIELLVTGGVRRADLALTSQGDFTSELENNILCTVEDKANLKGNKNALNKIKDFVTSPKITIHRKGLDSYDVPNHSHWCVSPDEWIITEDGPRQVRHLIGRPITIIYNGERIKTEGFFSTGMNELFEVETIEGYKTKVTSNHPLLANYDGFIYNTEVSKLKEDFELFLCQHKDLEWEGQGTWNDGYIIGYLIGDGCIRKLKNCNGYQNNILLCPPSYCLLDFICNLFHIHPKVSKYKYFSKIIHCEDEEIILSSPYLEELRIEYALDERKEINGHILSASSDFQRGFVSGFFDSDGNDNENGLRLSQSNLKRLEAIQLILIHLGIASKIYKSKKREDRVNTEIEYTLFITKSNIQEFDKRIRFYHPEKNCKLQNYIKNKKWTYPEPFTVRIKSITSIGIHETFNIHVPHIEHFSSNGFASHNCQMSNHADACPIFDGDTRITVIYVSPLEEIIPRKQFWNLLQKEAPDFLTHIMSLEIPPSTERLNIPVILTEEKLQLQESNQSELESFLKEKCFYAEGHSIKFSEFYEKFIEWLDPNSTPLWSRIKVSRELAPRFPVGASTLHANQKYIGNISWSQQNGEKLPRLITKEGKLICSK